MIRSPTLILLQYRVNKDHSAIFKLFPNSLHFPIKSALRLQIFHQFLSHMAISFVQLKNL